MIVVIIVVVPSFVVLVVSVVIPVIIVAISVIIIGRVIDFALFKRIYSGKIQPVFRKFFQVTEDYIVRYVFFIIDIVRFLHIVGNHLDQSFFFVALFKFDGFF